MDKRWMEARVPTFYGWWSRRKKARANQLPKHLRPPAVWPIWIQVALNLGIAWTLWELLWGRDEFLSDQTPAIGLSVTLVLLLYTVTQGWKLKRRFAGLKGRRLAKVNFWLMWAAFLLWPATVAFYLN